MGFAKDPNAAEVAVVLAGYLQGRAGKNFSASEFAEIMRAYKSACPAFT